MEKKRGRSLNEQELESTSGGNTRHTSVIEYETDINGDVVPDTIRKYNEEVEIPDNSQAQG